MYLYNSNTTELKYLENQKNKLRTTESQKHVHFKLKY